MLFVLSRPSPEHCKMREREQGREKYTDRQTDCDTTGGSTVHEPPLYLMSIRQTETTPYLVLLRWELQCWGRGIAKSNINIRHTQQLPTASISQIDLENVHERQTRKNRLKVNGMESQCANDVGKKESKNELYSGSVILFSIEATCIYWLNESECVKCIETKLTEKINPQKLNTSQHQLSL